MFKLLKSEYEKKESELMLKKLQNDPQKVPAPDQNQNMRLLVNSNKDVKIALLRLQVCFQVSLGYKRN